MELVKLYYRIGEVAQIVGVQPHVLRYWETEFRTIRPQKSGKGQRVYSRKDVEKLLRVKDLLKNQGFTIAGAKKKLREPGEAAEPGAVTSLAPAPDAGPQTQRMPEPERVYAPITLAPAPAPVPVPERVSFSVPPSAAPFVASPSAAPFVAPPVAAPLSAAPSPAPSAAPIEVPAAVFGPSPRERAALQNQARVREALLALREEMVVMLGDLERPPQRRPKLPTLG